MGDIEKKVSLPLDEEGYFRRGCPLCHKEFKILLSQEELTDLAQKRIDSFMLSQKEKEEEEKEDSQKEFFCPYCGQNSSYDSWWTHEQLAYITVIVENIFADLMNENLIKPLKRDFGRGNFIQIDAKEIKQKEPWISSETNDMEIFELPCCQRKIKIEENYNQKIYCYFCGFPYSKQK